MDIIPAHLIPKMYNVENSPLTEDTKCVLPAPDYFPAQLLSTTADTFQNVWKHKKCLRCYSDKHRAIQCPYFTTPTTTPCHSCRYLYHNEEACSAHLSPKMYTVETSPLTEDTKRVPPTTDTIPAPIKLVWKMMVLLEMTKLVIAKLPVDPSVDFDDYQTSPITTG